MNLEAILFDLHGTLGYVEEPISSEEISEYLLKRDYKVYVCMPSRTLQILGDLFWVNTEKLSASNRVNSSQA